MKLSKLVPKTFYFRLFFITKFFTIFKANNFKFNSIFPFITNNFIERNGFILSNYGVWMLNNFNDKTFNLSLLGYRNNLEKHLKSIKKPFTFIDIGCNQGVFSLVAGKNNYCKKIHCFEPNMDLLPYLEANLVFNGIKNYKIHNCAISNTEGNINFFVPSNHSGAGTLFKNYNEYNRVFRSVNRSYLENIRTDKEILFLKIDVEGSEYSVLVEIFNTSLLKDIKYIFVEINPMYYDSFKIRDLLLKNNFVEADRKGTIDSCDSLFISNEK